MFWKVLGYAGSLTDCNCSWSDIFPLSARTSMEGANFMSPKIWIWLRFPQCISPRGWSTEDLQAALYASMNIFFEWAGNLWPFSRVWDMKFESCWTVERLKLWEMSIYYSTLTQAKQSTGLAHLNWEPHGWARCRNVPDVIDPARLLACRVVCCSY